MLNIQPMHKKTAKRLVSLIICIVMLCPATAVVHAEQGTVLRASNLEEYIDATEALKGARLRTGSSGMIAESVFSTGRLKVKRELSSLEGAEEGVSYNGETLLRYGSAEEAMEAYERLSAEYGEENVIVDLPLFTAESQGWGTDYMNLDDEIRREISIHGENAPKVTVAVVDSGINSSHEIFRGTSISPLSKNLIEADGEITDENGHGTGVSGIIAESTPDNVEIMSLKVFGKSTNGTTEDINMAIEYAADNGADVINLSISSPHHEIIDSMEEYYPNLIANYLRELDLKLKYAAMKGVIVCAASGNDGGDLDELYSFPAFSQFTLAVGAINRTGERAAYSNYGNSLDFCAPGDDVLLADNSSTSGFNAGDGTSFATPYISACCAYVKMDNKQANYKDARESLKNISQDYGAEGWDKYYGWGMPHFEDMIEPEDNEPDKPDADKPGQVTPETGETVSVNDPAGSSLSNDKSIKTITINKKTVSAAVVRKAIKMAGGTPSGIKEIVIGRNVRKIKKAAFKGTKVKTLIIKSQKLKAKSVRKSLKGSKIKTIKIKVSGKKKTNRKYQKKYRRIFTKKNAGRKVRVKY